MTTLAMSFGPLWERQVAVASGEGTGRSATAQLLHASEVAFWDDLPIQVAALMQTVPDLPGTSSWKPRRILLILNIAEKSTLTS